MRGPSQFQQFTTLSPPFSGEPWREESPTSPLRFSGARQRLPKGPLWPFTGSPHAEQHAGLRITGAGAGDDAIGAVAQAVDMIGEEEMADTTVTVAKVAATGAVAGMEATDAEAGVTEEEAGAGVVVAAETAGAVEGITGADEDMGVEEEGFTTC